MKRLSTLLAASAAALLLSAQATFAASYADDFSISGNPNGAWTYGYVPNLDPGYSLTPYTHNATSSAGSATLEFWAANIGGDGTPLVTHNTSGFDYSAGTVYIPAHAASLHPGPGGQLSVARYTVPASGTYDLSATFTGYDTHGTTTDVHVLLNGASLFSDNVNTFLTSPKSFSAPLYLSAGDTIDFAVGIGGNNTYYFDTTGLSAQITSAVPTPAAAFGALPLLAAVAYRRHRRCGVTARPTP